MFVLSFKEKHEFIKKEHGDIYFNIKKCYTVLDGLQCSLFLDTFLFPLKMSNCVS